MTDPDFRWATGLECSFIPHLSIDQYRWTQHDRFWRTDFELLANDLGCRWVRYALPWHEIERTPGVFEWDWFDQRLAHVESLGITLMLDLAHFGTPTWLPDAFADPDFPVAIERFARAFGERYARRVKCVCPINEPLITALFCGDVGLWPPYGRGLNNYMTVLSRVAQGLSRAIRVLRETMPGVEILVSDSLEMAVTFEDSDETTSSIPARIAPGRRGTPDAPPPPRDGPRIRARGPAASPRGLAAKAWVLGLSTSIGSSATRRRSTSSAWTTTSTRRSSFTRRRRDTTGSVRSSRRWACTGRRRATGRSTTSR